MLLGVCGSALLAAALTLATGNSLIGILGGALGGWLGMHAALSIRIGRRRAPGGEPGFVHSGWVGRFPDQGQYAYKLAEVQDHEALLIGRVTYDSFAAAWPEREGVFADRMNSTDLRWTVMAIRIQREVGGNLAEVLRTTVGTMRERAFLRRQVSSLSAEGRLSAYILIVMPVLIGGWFFYSDRSYMRPLTPPWSGWSCLVGSAALIVVGALWMRKLTRSGEVSSTVLLLGGLRGRAGDRSGQWAAPPARAGQGGVTQALAAIEQRYNTSRGVPR